MTNEIESFYDILEVSKRASQETIKAAYRSLVQRYHPDRNKDTSANERLKSINIAYETLSNPVLRKKYDADINSSENTNSNNTSTESRQNDNKQTTDDKVVIQCPNCKQSLRVLANKSLYVTCSTCSHKFEIFSGEKNNKNKTDWSSHKENYNNELVFHSKNIKIDSFLFLFFCTFFFALLVYVQITAEHYNKLYSDVNSYNKNRETKEEIKTKNNTIEKQSSQYNNINNTKYVIDMISCAIKNSNKNYYSEILPLKNEIEKLPKPSQQFPLFI